MATVRHRSGNAGYWSCDEGAWRRKPETLGHKIPAVLQQRHRKLALLQGCQSPRYQGKKGGAKCFLLSKKQQYVVDGPQTQRRIKCQGLVITKCSCRLVQEGDWWIFLKLVLCNLPNWTNFIPIFYSGGLQQITGSDFSKSARRTFFKVCNLVLGRHVQQQ